MLVAFVLLKPWRLGLISSFREEAICDFRLKELVEEVSVEKYVLSRILGKLESHRYVGGRQEGTGKVVSLRKRE